MVDRVSISTRPLACVSVRQPWADLLAAGIKPIENRTWPCKYRGPLLIHAGKTWGRDEEAAYAELMAIAIDMRDVRRQTILMRSRDRLGGLVGICTMRRCIHEDAWYERGGLYYDGWHQWFTGPFGWVVTGARLFPTVVPYLGQQGIFSVPRHAVPWLDGRRERA